VKRRMRFTIHPLSPRGFSSEVRDSAARDRMRTRRAAPVRRLKDRLGAGSDFGRAQARPRRDETQDVFRNPLLHREWMQDFWAGRGSPAPVKTP